MSSIKHITVTVRKAEKKDLSLNKQPIYGTHFYVLNQDGQTLSGVHTINDTTNLKELNAWFKAGRIYVQESCIDHLIKFTNFNTI